MQTLLVWAQNSQLARLHEILTAGGNLKSPLVESGRETTVKIASPVHRPSMLPVLSLCMQKHAWA